MAINQILDRVVGTVTTTDGTTWTTVLGYTPVVNSVSRYEFYIAGKDSSNNGASFAGMGCISRTAEDLTLIGTGFANNFLSAALSAATFRVQVTGSVLEIQVKGVAATTIEWLCDMEIRIV